jgi:hypothetical protein
VGSLGAFRRVVVGMWTRRAATLVVILAVGAQACTSEPDPRPSDPPLVEDDAPQEVGGSSAALILPPAEALDDAVAEELREQLEAIAADAPDGVSEVRVHAPEDETFAGDLAATFGDRGVDLVCAMGDGALRAVASPSEVHRATRYCAVPAEHAEGDAPLLDEQNEGDHEGDDADEATRLELRAEELGHAVGVGARRAAGDGPVGLLLGGDELPGARFEAGLLAGLDGVDVVEVEDTGAPATEQLEALVGAGATAVVLDGGPDASVAAGALDGRAGLVAPSAVAAGHEDETVLTWSVRWDRLMTPRLRGLVEDDDPPERSFGFAEQAFEVTIGAAASATTGAAVADAVAGLRTGTRDAVLPVPGAEVEPLGRPEGD